MSYDVNYSAEKAPKVGIVANAITVFSLDGKIEAENQFRMLFEQFKKEGIISQDSLFYEKRTFDMNLKNRIKRLEDKLLKRNTVELTEGEKQIARLLSKDTVLRARANGVILDTVSACTKYFSQNKYGKR